MPNLYVVGGIGESVLSRSPNGANIVWIDLTVLMLGKVLELTLAPNGIDPEPPDGVQLYPSAVVGPYVGFPSTQLGFQLASAGWRIRPFPWDWRKTIYPSGQLLAQRIRQEVTEDEPCAIVGHSAGGLVARAAWTDLGTTGDQSKVSRIVTLGTPHWGSYAVVMFWSGDSSTIDLLNYWNQQIGYNTAGHLPGITGYRYLNTLDYQRLAMTWPSFYDMLPVLDEPGSDSDPHRSTLYTATNWPAAARPSQVWLDWSRDHTGPWLRSAASQPPPHVLTCISGYGLQFPSALIRPDQLGTSNAYGRYVEGDGAVTRAASELPGSVRWRYSINHENLMPDLVNNGNLADLVTEIRAPSPPPPPEVSTSPQTTNLQPIPFPEGLGEGPTSRACVGGACMC